ncbi:MAG: AAA family ATPase, partial [Oligoflexia bacterium]|nr:AAA family ATPase [Oligoflexia bacterium]
MIHKQFTQFERVINIDLPRGKSAFLWGPRKVGKSFWLKQNFPKVIVIDLLKSDIFAEYAARPSLLRERYLQEDASSTLIIIDEIQSVPTLLNEVHWMIENGNNAFILTGSSARKLRKGHANLLGGRAWRYVMLPLCYPEIKDFKGYTLKDIFQKGLIPSH